MNAVQIQAAVSFGPDGADMDVPKSWDGGADTVRLKIKPEFKMTGDKAYLLDDERELEIKITPTALYQKISAALAANRVELTDGFALDLKNGQPIYELTVKEPVKLFGLFPIKIKKTMEISAASGQALQEQKPWFSFLCRTENNLLDKLNLLPNMKVNDIRFEPATWKDGETVKVIATVKNVGLGSGGDGLSFSSHTGPGARLFVNGYEHQWYFIFLFLAPGGTQEFEFTWKEASCGADVEVAVADGDFIEETTKEDNRLLVKAMCQ